jgi:hypothetical protein
MGLKHRKHRKSLEQLFAEAERLQTQIALMSSRFEEAGRF